jgi:hypothetical protein
VPFLIDPGTVCYTTDARVRDRMRSTALHNTLVLDGRSQSIPNGPFHWSHVANGRVHRWRTSPGFDYFDGSHDGYRPIEHRRRVLVMHGDLVVVADFIAGGGSHTAAVHWHLDPGWSVGTRARGAIFTSGNGEGDRVGLTVPEGLVETFRGDERTGLGWYSSAYGRIEPTTTVRVTREAAAPFWMVSVFDLDERNQVADVDWIPVWAEGGVIAHAAAIRITRAASVDHVLFAEPRAETAEHAESAENTFGSAYSAVPTWRVGDVETNARMLFYRSTTEQPFARLGFVDGSLARTASRRNLEVTLAEIVPAFFSDGTNAERRTPNDERRTTEDQQPCAASPVL